MVAAPERTLVDVNDALVQFSIDTARQSDSLRALTVSLETAKKRGIEKAQESVQLHEPIGCVQELVRDAFVAAEPTWTSIESFENDYLKPLSDVGLAGQGRSKGRPNDTLLRDFVFVYETFADVARRPRLSDRGYIELAARAGVIIQREHHGSIDGRGHKRSIEAARKLAPFRFEGPMDVSAVAPVHQYLAAAAEKLMGTETPSTRSRPMPDEYALWIAWRYSASWQGRAPSNWKHVAFRRDGDIVVLQLARRAWAADGYEYAGRATVSVSIPYNRLLDHITAIIQNVDSICSTLIASSDTTSWSTDGVAVEVQRLGREN